MSDPPREEILFRTLSAPGLDEDDLFAVLCGLPGAGALWGEGRPPPAVIGEPSWDESAERRRRHEALMRKWSAGEGTRPPPPGP
jgi:hypothetical protein